MLLGSLRLLAYEGSTHYTLTARSSTFQSPFLQVLRVRFLVSVIIVIGGSRLAPQTIEAQSSILQASFKIGES